MDANGVTLRDMALLIEKSQGRDVRVCDLSRKGDKEDPESEDAGREKQADAAFHPNPTPRSAMNARGSCGFPPTRVSKWRWHPVEFPVVPA